jgi:hypothetical protein
MIGKNVNSRDILTSLPGVNRVPSSKPRGFNMDFQSYNPPLAYRIRKQDEEGGAVFWMLVALVVGGIVAAIVL